VSLLRMLARSSAPAATEKQTDSQTANADVGIFLITQTSVLFVAALRAADSPRS
jgi:hypothetical protein